MSGVNKTYVDRTRARFKQLIEARQHGCNMKPEQIWRIWKIDRETWSHEYWLLTLELKQIKKAKDIEVAP